MIEASREINIIAFRLFSKHERDKIDNNDDELIII